MALPVTKLPLHVPPLQEVAQVLQSGLQKNFSSVSVSVVDCPDLTQKPFNLSAQGLCGCPRLVDVGGPAYLLPLVQKDKLYDLGDVAKLAELPGAFMVGAGAGPWKVVGGNSELACNVQVSPHGSGALRCNSHVAKVDAKAGCCVLSQLKDTLNFNLMGNFHLCEGKPGKPDFSSTPLTCDAEVNKWLKFYEMDATLICLGELVSHDPGLDLRVEHFHCFSEHGQGGHYHYDTTPGEVVYRAYFNVAELLYRIDQPPADSAPAKFGR